MSVVFVSTYPPARCGIGYYTQHLLRAFPKDYPRSVIAERLPLGGAYPVEGKEFQIIRSWRRGAPFRSPDGLGSILLLLEASEKLPDVVHIQHEFGLFPSTQDLRMLIDGLKELSVKSIITLHTVLRPPAHTDFFAQSWGEVVVHTPAQKAILVGDWGVPGDHVHVIPHGCPLTPSHDPHGYFLCPGFISRSKNHKEILQGYALSRSTVPLYIIGACREDRYLSELEDEVQGLGIADKVVLDVSFQEDLTPALTKARAVVLGGPTTRDREYLPYSASGQVHDAIGRGIPVVAKNVPIYQDGAQLLFESASQLSAYFRALEEPLFTAQLGGRAHQTAGPRNWKHIGDLTRELYQ